jgi:hypothetical protein
MYDDHRPQQARPTTDALNAATMATLAANPSSPQAEQLAAEVVARIEAHEQATGARKRRRTSAASASFVHAVGGFLADLLRVPQDAPRFGLVYRSLHATSFTGGPATYDGFIGALKGMVALGLVETFGGFSNEHRTDWGDGVVSTHREGKASRYRATPALLELAAQHLGPPPYRNHFRDPASNRLVVLMPSSQRVGGKKKKGRPLPIPDAPEVERIKAQVRTINEFLSGVTIGGGEHRAFFRQFEQGDLPGFRWNRGGRLYSEGEGHYQQAKPDVRLAMTLNGKPVVEIDIRASYLTIVHGLAGQPLDLEQDPYGVEGVPRELVKAWTTASLSEGQAQRRWPRRTTDSFREKTGLLLADEHPVAEVADVMTRRFPVLARLPDLGVGWGELMYLESEAMVQTLLQLIDQGIPALPVHDSLILAHEHEDLGRTVLSSCYETMVGITPTLIT